MEINGDDVTCDITENVTAPRVCVKVTSSTYVHCTYVHVYVVIMTQTNEFKLSHVSCYT